MDKSNKKNKILHKCLTANTSAIWQHAAHTTDQLTSPSRWTGAIQKSLSLHEKYWRILWKKFRKMDWQAEKVMTERVTGLGRRTREKMAKWNQMTALRFQTGGDNRHPRPRTHWKKTTLKKWMQNEVTWKAHTNLNHLCKAHTEEHQFWKWCADENHIWTAHILKEITFENHKWIHSPLRSTCWWSQSALWCVRVALGERWLRSSPLLHPGASWDHLHLPAPSPAHS